MTKPLKNPTRKIPPREKRPSLAEQIEGLRSTNAELLRTCGLRNEAITKAQRENRDLAERVREATAPFRMENNNDVRSAASAALERMRLLNAEQAFHLLSILAAAYRITLAPPTPSFATAQESK